MWTKRTNSGERFSTKRRWICWKIFRTIVNKDWAQIPAKSRIQRPSCLYLIWSSNWPTVWPTNTFLMIWLQPSNWSKTSKIQKIIAYLTKQVSSQWMSTLWFHLEHTSKHWMSSCRIETCSRSMLRRLFQPYLHQSLCLTNLDFLCLASDLLQ